MPIQYWDPRFFRSTRGQLILLLRGTGQTVRELALTVGLSENAVRAHLDALERDGLVHQEVLRRGVGKPAYSYRLSAQAEALFGQAHEIVLAELLDILDERVGSEQVEDILRSLGRRIASRQIMPEGDFRARLEEANRVLNELGGFVRLEESETTFSFCGYTCPLADLGTRHPELCLLVESLLTDLVGAPVTQRCERSQALRCRLELPKAPAPAQAAG